MTSRNQIVFKKKLQCLRIAFITKSNAKIGSLVLLFPSVRSIAITDTITGFLPVANTFCFQITAYFPSEHALHGLDEDSKVSSWDIHIGQLRLNHHFSPRASEMQTFIMELDVLQLHSP